MFRRRDGETEKKGKKGKKNKIKGGITSYHFACFSRIDGGGPYMHDSDSEH